MSPILVRPMLDADIERVLTIERASSPDPWTEGIMHDELHGASRCYLVAEQANELVGFCGLLLQVDEGHITNVAVVPKFRGQRIAARLLLPLIRWGLGQHISALTLEVRVGNEAAIRLYRRFGFAPVGTRPRYYPNGDDALILWAHDVDSADYSARLLLVEAWLATARQDSLSTYGSIE